VRYGTGTVAQDAAVTSTRAIVVGVDQRPAAGPALEWAAQYAQSHDAKVVAVHANCGTWFLDAMQVDTDRVRRDEAAEFEAEWAKPLADAGVEYETVDCEGRAASELATTAEKVGADVIVIGHHVHEGHRHHHLGGVVKDLLERAQRPVVVVPWVDPTR
jgi:nucleotide-binding universal stress UspA family protein